MLSIVTAKGIRVECDVITRGHAYDVLHIYTDAISPVQAYQIFGDPEQTVVLTVYEDDAIRDVYYNFTDIYSVQKSALVDGENELLIWLDYKEPEQNQEEEVT